MRTATVEIEVPFHDVDVGHVVWHGHYYKYMELARTALMRQCLLDVPDVLQLGFRMAVIDSSCRYTFPLRYGDAARIEAKILDTDHRINIGYSIYNLTAERRSARGRTSLVTLTSNNELLLETPAPILARLTNGDA